MPSIRVGRRIAIDFGEVRIGVAASTPDGIFSSPLATLTNDDQAIASLLTIFQEVEPIEIYVGLPLNLKGLSTASTSSAIDFAKEIAKLSSIPVRLVDERLSTRAAQSQMHSSGKNTKQSRGVIDAAAASLILESALDFERSTSRLPGKSVEEFFE